MLVHSATFPRRSLHCLSRRLFPGGCRVLTDTLTVAFAGKEMCIAPLYMTEEEAALMLAHHVGLTGKVEKE